MDRAEQVEQPPQRDDAEFEGNYTAFRKAYKAWSSREARERQRSKRLQVQHANKTPGGLSGVDVTFGEKEIRNGSLPMYKNKRTPALALAP